MKRTKTKKKSSKQPQKGSKPVKWNGDRMRQVYELALLGLTEEVMCKVMDVHIKTFEYWKKTKPALLKTLRDGKEIADAKVATAFYKSATGYSHPDTYITTSREKEYDDKGNLTREYTMVHQVPIIKHYPPNAYAALKWLQLRQREAWADVNKFEITNIHKIQKIDLTQFSEPELKVMEKLGISNLLKQLPENSNN